MRAGGTRWHRHAGGEGGHGAALQGRDIAGTRGKVAGVDEELWDDPSGHRAAHPPPHSWPLRRTFPALRWGQEPGRCIKGSWKLGGGHYCHLQLAWRWVTKCPPRD